MSRKADAGWRTNSAPHALIFFPIHCEIPSFRPENTTPHGRTPHQIKRNSYIVLSDVDVPAITKSLRHHDARDSEDRERPPPTTTLHDRTSSTAPLHLTLLFLHRARSRRSSKIANILANATGMKD